MTNSYSINHCTWKWTKKLFFCMFDLAILNSYILFFSCGGEKISHGDFHLTLLGNLLAQAGQERNVQRRICRTPAAATPVVRLKNVVENFGLFCLSRKEDVMYVWPGVSPEMFQ